MCECLWNQKRREGRAQVALKPQSEEIRYRKCMNALTGCAKDIRKETRTFGPIQCVKEIVVSEWRGKEEG